MPSTGTWPAGSSNRGRLIAACLLGLLCRCRAQYSVNYREPRLECLSDGIRLHIDPVGVFVGHVYVTGHFVGDKCHLNYCRQSVQDPFVMDVPYRGGCNVRRHRSPQPKTVSYEVTVVIQHHPLFITAGDRAYRLNCIYRQADAMLTQKININELPPTTLDGASSPQCRYDVLTALNGPALLVANVGEPVVHRWSCNSNSHGFLVHSCVVRDQTGTEYKLVDERGCVIEKNLVPDITYASDLSYAYTTINAFRFAEQIMVHFSCQITLCQKRDQGCEGIAPPTCHPIEFPPIQAIYRHSSTTTAPVRSPVPLPSRYGVNAADEYHVYNKITTQDRTTTIHPNTKPKSPASDAVPVTPSFVYPTKKTEEESATYASSIGTTDEFGLEISNKVEDGSLRRRAQGYRTETISSIYDLPAGLTLDPLPMPSPANVFYASNVKARSKREDAENITVEVEAKRMLVFSSDDSERIDTAALRRGGDSEKEPCGRVLIVQTVFLCVAAVLQVISVVVILLQRRLYHRNLRALWLRCSNNRQ